MKAREIELGDAFIALKIVKKLGLESLREIVGIESSEGLTPEDRQKLLNKKAFEVVSYLLTHLEGAETEIILLLSGWSGTTPEEFKKIKLSELPEMIDEFIKLNGKETLISFFERAVAALTKQ